MFEAVGGESFQIDVAPGRLADSVVALYNADEWRLAFNDDYEASPASRILWKAPGSGSSYIDVFSSHDGTISL